MDNERFRHLFTLSYDNIIPFIFEYIKKHTLPLILGWSFLLAVLIWLVDFRFALAADHRFINILMHSSIGIVILPMVLVIPHELLHIVPYYLSGARNIRVGADWQQYYFYVTAHLYPVGAATFITVALTPFLVISAGLIYLIVITASPLWSWSLMWTLFMHTTMCAGDFALINFYWLNRHKKVITWDDADKKEAHFYEEIKEE